MLSNKQAQQGWMNGVGVISNVGLLDQRFAFEWV